MSHHVCTCNGRSSHSSSCGAMNHVRKVAAQMPVSVEQLIDAGYPPPPGYEPPPRPEVSRWQRWRRKWAVRRLDVRDPRPMGDICLRDNFKPDGPVCERCGDAGTQLHHWAPSAIFGAESDEWPTGWLCPDCHRQWHRLMRKAGGHSLHADLED